MVVNRLTRLPSGPLEIDDHYRLEGLCFSVADVGPVAPLFHGLDGGGSQGRVTFDQAHALNLTVFVHDGLEDNCSFHLTRARCSGIFRRNAVRQPLFRALGRENHGAAFPGEWCAGRSCSHDISTAVA